MSNNEDMRVGLLDALAEYNCVGGMEPKTAVKGLLLFTVLLHLGSQTLLLVFNTQSRREAQRDFSFEQSTLDCLVLAVLQCVLLPLVAYLGYRMGTVPSSLEPFPEVKRCDCFRCFYGKNRLERTDGAHKPNVNNSELRVGLLEGRDAYEERKTDMESVIALDINDGSINIEPSNEGFESEDNILKQNVKLLDETYLKSRSIAKANKQVMMAVLFLLSTTSQVYVGIKCINFDFAKEGRDGTLMGIAVLWTNMIVWCLGQLVEVNTKEEGEMVPSLHPHRLHMHTSLANHWCDVCGSQIKDGRSYRCKLCDFDICSRCFSKKDTSMVEGVLRGDKGVRMDEDLSGGAYFLRGLRLACTEWQIFFIAIISLLCYNGATLWLPNLQGSILDSVVKMDTKVFTAHIGQYISISTALCIFVSIQSLCFNVVGRRLANTVRNRLFKGIIVQDVAFFDGNTSGQLTSRLTTDVSYMIQPIQSMLGSILSNSILLVGGMFMCFHTSWRLSILAFTTVGPIYHVTQVYAGWSKHLNRQIYAALATANSFANEALGNIRTVKAFCTERAERDRYELASGVALQKGIQDAYGGAGMNAINSVLDLGAGVLILWYGGLLAMHHSDRLSPGKLITYQLYWNMLNNAYKNLTDILTSVTRAAGAAQRVFLLMDSLPDIDIDAGHPVDDVRGELTLRSVTFSYQMRPDHQVLRGISLNIPAGSRCALVGRSGGGKSTLVHLLLRFYDPQSGSIELDSKPLDTLRLRDVRKHMGVVAQDTQLFACSIEENITYGLEPGTWTRQDVVRAAKMACAHDFIKGFPEGYATRCGERGSRISGGQKQRIAIARVFLKNPRILLLDEATSALDAESESQVQEAIDRLIETTKATVILVAHRLSTVINADNIAVVNEGQIVEQGTHSSLLKQDGIYAKLVARQVAKQQNTLDQTASSSKPVDSIDDILDELAKKQKA